MSRYRVCRHKKGTQAGVVERSIYEDVTGAKYLRIQNSDGDHFKNLHTKSLTQAVELRDELLRAQGRANLGLVEDPDKTAEAIRVTVAMVILAYQAANYPTKRGVARKTTGRHRNAEEGYCRTLLEFFNGNAAATNLTQNDLDLYHNWRVETLEKNRLEAIELKKKAEAEKAKLKAEKLAIKAGKPLAPAPLAEDEGTTLGTKQGRKPQRVGDGHRTTDLELNTLNNAFRWALRKGMVRINPIASRARYYSAGDATHCKEYSVESADELHTAASKLMASRRSEVAGWQLLIEGMSGLRTEEAVTLRMGVGAQEPGGLTPDGSNLCVRRAEKSKKANPNVRVHEGLALVLKAHAIWHAQRYPLSPYYLPGRDRKKALHIDKSVLTKGLDRLFRKKVLPKKYTSHGAGRAFFIYARRCQGATDPEICYEVNHTGGVGTLESVYALPARHWSTGGAPGMSWLPTGKPAWTVIKDVDFSALDAKPAPEAAKVETPEEVIGFGGAKVVCTAPGKVEVRGGAPAEREQAEAWIRKFWRA